MKNRYRNLFLLFGILAIVIMLCTMDMDYSDIWGEREAHRLLVSCNHVVVVLCLSDKYLFMVSDNQGRPSI